MSTAETSTGSTLLERATLGTRVRDYLLVEIANGRLAPGSPVRELDIAKRLGTSQTPVREAFRELAAFGLLEARSHVGTRVREVGERELAEAVPVRAALEAVAAQLAAPHVAADPSRLEAALDELIRVASLGDRLAYANACTQFHREFVRSAQNDSLLRAWNALGIEIMTIMTMLTNSEPLDAAAQGHRPIVEALASGDVDRSVAIVNAHVAAYIPGATQPPVRSVPG
ncbi:GntR family transcriptional regulator [Agromyces soli]